jgi:hypothetical protein
MRTARRPCMAPNGKQVVCARTSSQARPKPCRNDEIRLVTGRASLSRACTAGWLAQSGVPAPFKLNLSPSLPSCARLVNSDDERQLLARSKRAPVSKRMRERWCAGTCLGHPASVLRTSSV